MLYGKVGEETFGGSRYLNQAFYKSKEWKTFRNEIILRDHGCDLGLENYPVDRFAIIHHINPITKEDIINRNPCVFDKNNVILVSRKTHDIIHYAFSLEGIETEEVIFREPNDTTLW